MRVNSILVGINFVTYVQLIITSQLEATVAVCSSRVKSINAVWLLVVSLCIAKIEVWLYVGHWCQ
jgi:hypothetical protein